MADFNFKAGEAVGIGTRDVTPEDTKSRLYFSYFGGLTGVVDRAYDDGTVCVEIDMDSLSAEMRDRHLAMQEAERRRWLDGLSGEARSRLSEDQRRLRISYKVLVSKKDLEKRLGGKPKKAADSGSDVPKDAPADAKGPARAPGPEVATEPRVKEPVEDVAPKRLSEAELAAKEEEFLRSRQGK